MEKRGFADGGGGLLFKKCVVWGGGGRMRKYCVSDGGERKAYMHD